MSVAKKDRELVGKAWNSTLNVYKYPPKPKKPIAKKPQPKIKRVSDKRRKQESEYGKKRIAYLTAHQVCEVRHAGCMYEATDIHHKAGRVGDLLTDERYFLAVCRKCHNHVEEHPAWAKEKGYSLSRLNIK